MIRMFRLSASVLAASVLAAALVVSTCPGLGNGPAQAATSAQISTQVPGYYRHGLGQFQVTALYDGYIDLDLKLWKGLSADKLQTLVAHMFQSHTLGVQTAVNAYLVHTGNHLVLVDAGAAACFGPTLGKINDNIKASGYRPEDVDTVLLTHMHPDHLCGLADADGKPAFANAEIWATQADADFWLSDKIAAQAAEGTRPMFQMAAKAVAPYQALGRFKTFKPGDTLVDGIQALDTHGHTPGHTSYLFQSKGEKMLIWGDIVHNHAIQFARPQVSVEFDSDQKQAIASREKIMGQAAKNGWAIAGAHLPFPGLGHIRKDKHAYAWVPVEFSPLRSDR